MNAKNNFQITLTNEKAEEIFFNALCNGQHYLGDYGYSMNYNNKEFRKAVKDIEAQGIGGCLEDIWMQMLRNGDKLSLVNIDEEENFEITLQDVYTNMALVPTFHLMDMLNEKDDAITADAILQTIFFKDIVYC